MHIKTRHYGGFLGAEITIGDVSVDLGMLDEREREELVQQLIDAAVDVLPQKYEWTDTYLRGFRFQEEEDGQS